METLLYADVFFFITAIAIVVLGAAGLVALVYLVQVLAEAKHIAKVIRTEVEKIAGDVRDLRMKLKEEGQALRGIASFIERLGFRKKVRGAKKTKK